MTKFPNLENPMLLYILNMLNFCNAKIFKDFGGYMIILNIFKQCLKCCLKCCLYVCLIVQI